MEQFLSVSLAVGGEQWGFSFLLCHPHVSVPLQMTHLRARHHRFRTEHVRYLLRNGRAINLCCVPCGYLGNTGAWPGRGMLQTALALVRVPALSATAQWPLPSVQSGTSVLSPAEGRGGPRPRGLEKHQDPPTKRSKKQKGLVSKMTVTAIRTAGIWSCISILHHYTNNFSTSPFHSLCVWRLNETIY